MTREQKELWVTNKVNNIIKELETTDVVKESTCDYRGWDIIAHLLMPSVAHKLRQQNYSVIVKVNHGVTDYLIA